MKTFIISTAIFSALIAIIIFNNIYINNSAEKLEELAGNITTGTGNIEERVAELEAFWNKNKDKMEFTTNHTSINSIGIKIINIRLFADNHDDIQLAREVLLLKEEIREMRRLEKFSIENIF